MMKHKNTFFSSLLAALCSFLFFSAGAQTSQELEIKAGELVRKGNFDEAMRHYAQAVKLAPHDTSLLESAAESAILAKQFDKSEEYFLAALREDSVRFSAVNGLGTLYAQTMRIEKGLVQYDKALRLAQTAKQRKEVYSNVAQAEQMRKNFPAVRNALSACFRIDSSFAAPWYTYSLLLKKFNLPDSAIYALKRTIRCDSAHAKAYNDLIPLLSQQNKFAETVLYCNAAAKHHFGSVMTYQSSGYAQTKLKNYPEAETDLQNALKLDMRNALTYRNLGLLYLDQKLNDKACEQFAKAIELGYTLKYNDEVEQLRKKNCH